MAKVILRIAIIGALVIGGFLLRDRISGNPDELKVGDCFDVPAAATAVADVQHHPCTEPHTGEVVFVGDHPAAKGTPFTEKLLVDWVGSACVPAFNGYVGSDRSFGLDIGAFYPLQNDWDSGDRGITCYLYQVDSSSMTQSLKGR